MKVPALEKTETTTNIHASDHTNYPVELRANVHPFGKYPRPISGRTRTES